MAKKSDSTTHNEERRAKMEAESDEQIMEREVAEEERKEKQAKRDEQSREQESQLLTQHANLIKDGETRDQLLERIREMREDVPAGPPPPPPLTAYMKQQLDIEQQAGADAVMKATENWERGREARRKAEEEKTAREGAMTPVHHPNPGMHEQFPTQGPAMGKKK